MPTQTRRWLVAKLRGEVLGPDQFDEYMNGRKFAKKAETKALYRALYSEIEVSVDKAFNIDRLNTILDGHPSTDPAIVNWAIETGIKKLIYKRCPIFSIFLKNINPGADVQIKSAIWLKKASVTIDNIVQYKNKLRTLRNERWTREMTDSEKQGEVRVLGGISEGLLESAFESKIDGVKFLRTMNPEIQSYGDFILMALPNNLWISVKSGFSRERLLASGFSNDLIGVGFFQEAKEFTTESKVRNFKKVGFLAIYLPDVPVSAAQEQDQSNTYNLVKSAYDINERAIPTNINGKPFFRKLSDLGNDLDSLLDEALEKRTTINF